MRLIRIEATWKLKVMKKALLHTLEHVILSWATVILESQIALTSLLSYELQYSGGPLLDLDISVDSTAESITGLFWSHLTLEGPDSARVSSRGERLS